MFWLQRWTSYPQSTAYNKMFLFFKEMDRDVGPLVTTRNVPGHIPCQGCRFVGWRKVPADRSLQPSGCAIHRLFTLRKVFGNLQSDG